MSYGEMEGSVTCWLEALKRDHPDAAQALWQRYLGQLLVLAQARMQAACVPQAVQDEEDVALSAFQSFFEGVRAGRFPKLDNRDDFWKLLITITHRKVVDLVKARAAQKRGAGRVLNEADLPGGDSEEAFQPLEQIISREPTPEFAAMLADEQRRLLGLLSNPVLRQIAAWKFAGYTSGEIQERLGGSLRRVTLKLELIQRIWATELAS